MGEVKWIKIVTDLFDDEKIRFIETLPKADSIIVIWFKLLCLAGKQNNSGVFTLSNGLPYTDKMFATMFNRPVNIIRTAFETFESYGMIEITDSVVSIPNWEKHQSIDKLNVVREQTRKRVAKHRGEKKQDVTHTMSDNVTQCNANVTQNVTDDVTQCNATDKIRGDKIRGDKIRERENKEIPTPAQTYGIFANVSLSDSEYAKLKELYPDDYTAKIDNLSAYIQKTGNYYNGEHMAVIVKWASEDERKTKNDGSSGKKYSFTDMDNHSYSNDDFENMFDDFTEGTEEKKNDKRTSNGNS